MFGDLTILLQFYFHCCFWRMKLHASCVTNIHPSSNQTLHALNAWSVSHDATPAHMCVCVCCNRFRLPMGISLTILPDWKKSHTQYKNLTQTYVRLPVHEMFVEAIKFHCNDGERAFFVVDRNTSISMILKNVLRLARVCSHCVDFNNATALSQLI